MDKYCKSECQDKRREKCKLPTASEVVIAHGRIAVRRVMEATSRVGRVMGEERFEPDWQLGEALFALDSIKRRVTDCVEEHQFSNVVHLRTD